MKFSVKCGLAALTQVGVMSAITGTTLVLTLPAQAQMKMQKSSSFSAASTTWSKIEASAAELDKTVKAGKFSEVHEVAFAVRDDVVTLPAKSSALSADKKKKLAGYTRSVSEIAGLLDKYGDSNNASGVKAQHARMKAALNSIKALYPAGTFKAMSGSKMPSMNGMKMEAGEHDKMEKGHHEH